MNRATTFVIGLFLVLLAVGVGCGGNAPVTRSTFAVTGKTYNEVYTCNETFPPSTTLSCPDLNETDVIQFTALGGNEYEARDVPDTGYLYHGFFFGTIFQWTATSPLGYHESGTWTFNTSGSAFSGDSNYVANDGSYQGDCLETGAQVPKVPANPPTPAGCP